MYIMPTGGGLMQDYGGSLILLLLLLITLADPAHNAGAVDDQQWKGNCNQQWSPGFSADTIYGLSKYVHIGLLA